MSGTGVSVGRDTCSAAQTSPDKGNDSRRYILLGGDCDGATVARIADLLTDTLARCPPCVSTLPATNGAALVEVLRNECPDGAVVVLAPGEGPASVLVDAAELAGDCGLDVSRVLVSTCASWSDDGDVLGIDRRAFAFARVAAEIHRPQGEPTTATLRSIRWAGPRAPVDGDSRVVLIGKATDADCDAVRACWPLDDGPAVVVGRWSYRGAANGLAEALANECARGAVVLYRRNDARASAAIRRLVDVVAGWNPAATVGAARWAVAECADWTSADAVSRARSELVGVDVLADAARRARERPLHERAASERGAQARQARDFTPLVAGWAEAAGALWRVHPSGKEGAEPTYERICAQVPRVTHIVRDVTVPGQSAYSLDVEWQAPGGRRTEKATVDAGDLVDSRTAGGDLSARGLILSSKSAAGVCAYLEAVASAGTHPERARIRRCGWYDPADGAPPRFVLPPLGAGDSADLPALEIEGELGKGPASLVPAGSLESYCDGTLSLLDPTGADYSPAAALAIAASLAAPLLSAASPAVESWVLDLVGGSSSGKTTVSRVAQAVWGAVGKDGAEVGGGTRFGLTLLLGTLAHAPLFLDDAEHMIRPVGGDVDAGRCQLVHQISAGRGDAAGTRGGGLREAMVWRTVVIATSNSGLSRPDDPDDVRGRVVSWTRRPLPAERSDLATRLQALASEHHGHLGRAFVRAIGWPEAREAIDRWRAWTVAGGPVAQPADPSQWRGLGPRAGWQDRQCGYLATALAAADLVERYAGPLGVPRPWAEALALATQAAVRIIGEAWAAEDCANPGDRYLAAVRGAIASRPARWQRPGVPQPACDPGSGYAGRVIISTGPKDAPCGSWVFATDEEVRALCRSANVTRDQVFESLDRDRGGVSWVKCEAGRRGISQRVWDAKVRGLQVWMPDDSPAERS